MSQEAARDFPRRSAVTRRFTLGAPRAFAVAPDGARVAFLRSASGHDPVQALWVLDVPGGHERCVLDPRDLGTADDVPPEERARRERAREQAGGIVRFATDRAVARAVAALGSSAFAIDLGTGETRALGLPGPVVDPRLDPTGTRVAWVRDGALMATALDAVQPTVVAADQDEDVTWGLAEFIAAEEMQRSRGYWWSPDGRRLLAARVDTRPVGRWHLSEPAEPGEAPRAIRYPAAGTANADVRLAVLGLDGRRTDVDWDREGLPYVVHVFWQRDRPPTIVVQSRDQRRVEVRSVDEDSGATSLVAAADGDPWLEIVPGAPRWVGGGRLLTVADDPRAGKGGTRRVLLDSEPLSPPGLQVREVAGADAATRTSDASAGDPTEVGVWRLPLDGGEPARLDGGGGVARVAGGPTAHVLTQARLDRAAEATVHAGEWRRLVPSHAEDPRLRPRLELLELGGDRLRGALLLPADHRAEDGPLPVLLDPYGGPHAQRVLRARDAFLASQWFAEQGFAVLVADGRGSPGREPRWEHAVAGDLAGPPLADQVAALEAAADARPGLLDLGRVAIRGWSFGGFLAALAVLRRPDVFGAAVAGAPVTDWRLYDTHYTERYLGHPDERPEAYERSSLLADAHRLQRPLLLIHGLADDNVVAAHTLRLSRALVEAGRPHRVLPLSGVTHMTPQEVVAEHLLRLQVAFLREALGLDGS